ncbi:unnamed protein product [Agarophyton chilense]|eukprot:gb/GEZJ01004926.1/.p3 GENE.gb/GEZJ01004926.1/~~gb/GEZJ01004926.1/.p3  ORF type:complete len:138 (-),score=32.97 gb/GEZJ01004926.1/:1935-2348(-)
MRVFVALAALAALSGTVCAAPFVLPPLQAGELLPPSDERAQSPQLAVREFGHLNYTAPHAAAEEPSPVAEPSPAAELSTEPAEEHAEEPEPSAELALETAVRQVQETDEPMSSEEPLQAERSEPPMVFPNNQRPFAI